MCDKCKYLDNDSNKKPCNNCIHWDTDGYLEFRNYKPIEKQ